MTPKRWKQVKTLLDETLALPSDARSGYLAEACGADKTLFEEVESLLGFEYSKENDVFENGRVTSAANFTADNRSDGLIGRQIGKYRIVRELGAGGMGVVFLAERFGDDFEQKVAVKFLRQSFYSQSTLNRFLSERQILARLHHRFIAQLIDGGTTTDGTPYLMMEYVEGTPITDYAAEKNLSLEERLSLFGKVCSAVSFAHRNLVIHRDLKPDNILITAEGVPKLLDFGIAKLLTASETKATVTRLQAFTPEYASPEQIAGKMITTASDVYVLGIILFELLSGTRPFRFNTADRPEIIWRTVRDSEPPKPSQAVQTETRKDASEQNIAARLKGDLDNIVLKAIDAEPERRYSSVEQLAEDLRRFEKGLPVLARPNTFGYRAGKFLKRNQFTVAAAVLIGLSLIAGTLISVREALVARQQTGVAREQTVLAVAAEENAVEETEKTRKAAEKAQKISRFMEKILSYANPAMYAEGARTGGRARIIDVVDDLAGKIDDEFPDDPEIAAELHYQVGDIYRANIKDKKFLYHATRALELRRQALGDKNPEVAKDLYYYAVALYHNNRPAEYDAILDEAIAMMRQTDPQNINLPHMLTDKALRLMAKNESAERLGDFAAADWQTPEHLANEALTLFRAHYPDSHYIILNAYVNLRNLALRRKDFAAADAYKREIADRFERLPKYQQKEIYDELTFLDRLEIKIRQEMPRSNFKN